jgi:hypothetical protein
VGIRAYQAENPGGYAEARKEDPPHFNGKEGLRGERRGETEWACIGMAILASGRMLCLSGSAYPTQRDMDRANPLLVRVRAPRSSDRRIRHFGAIAGKSRVIWSPGMKP